MRDGEQVTYTVHVHSEDGAYWAEVEELPGCFAAGDTWDELEESLAEAVGLYLSDGDFTVRVVPGSREKLESVVSQKFLVSA